MKTLILPVLVACSPDREPPTDATFAGTTSEITVPPDTGPAVGPAVGPAPVDVLALRDEPVPDLPYARRFTVELAGEAGASVACTLEAAPPAWRQLVPLQASWRYVGGGVDPGPGWASPGYDDSGWATGTAPFGDAQPAVTDLAPQGRPPAVAWFRAAFSVDDPEDIAELWLSARRDDGIVVYINGTEVLRDNVPVGAPIDGWDIERTLLDVALAVPPGTLAAGENVVAVELHQEPGSDDAGFDLRLAALVGGEPAGPEVQLVESQAPATEHALTMYGLLAGASYACVARGAIPGGQAVELAVATEPDATPLPALAAHPAHAEPSWGAYTLFNHQRPCASEYDNHLIVVDPEGRARWTYHVGMAERSTIDLESALVGNDAVLWGGAGLPEGAPQIVGLDGQVRYTAAYPGAELDLYHHDLEQLADGRLLGLTESEVRGSGGSWDGFSLVEHDPATGAVTWRWDAQAAYDRGELPAPAGGDDDPYHANSLAAVSDADGDGVYVSLLYQKEVIRIDRATGGVLWRLGPYSDFQLVDSAGAPLSAELWFSNLHALNLYGDRLYLYDNGWGGGFSRAMALRVDGPARTAEIAWAWTEFGWYEPNWGDVDELPNGAVLIAMAHSHCLGGNPGHRGSLVEVVPPGDVAWRLDFLDADDSMYRAQRIDGCALFANSRFCPAVAQRVAALEKHF